MNSTKLGPGGHLKIIFRQLGFDPNSTCWCNAYAEQMDLWGPVGCRERLDEIIAHLRKMRKDTSLKQIIRGAVLALAREETFIDPTRIEKSLVLEAIRRAEEEG